ncbi:MAG: hypothetical protein ABI042_11110 [Verrucomicrobiota bacterium]
MARVPKERLYPTHVETVGYGRLSLRDKETGHIKMRQPARKLMKIGKTGAINYQPVDG